MDFESSPIWTEIRDLISSPVKRKLFDYKLTIHTAKEDYAVWDLHFIEIHRDYVSKVSEFGNLAFKLGLGDYTHRLYPYRNNLEVTLKKLPVGEQGDLDSTGIEVTRYKAIFNPQRNPPVGGSELEGINQEDLNNKEIVEVHLEIIDRSAEPLRIKTTTGSYMNVTPEKAIRAIMGGESAKIRVDGKVCIDAIDLVPPDNKESIPNLIIPPMQITAFPTFLQQKICGVYNRAIGTFYQKYKGKKTWYIYPLYDTERFDGKDPKAVFYFVPQDRLPQIDRSFISEGDILKIAVTAQRIYTDSAELKLMNEGSGYRMPDARSYMKKPVKMTEDGPVGARANLNHEVSIKSRDDGLNYVPWKDGPSRNPFHQRSEILKNYMGQFDLVWENSDHNLIYPGMPCKCTYLSQGKVKSLKGTVLFSSTLITKAEKYNASPFRSITRISLACEPKSDTPEQSTTGVAGD